MFFFLLSETTLLKTFFESPPYPSTGITKVTLSRQNLSFQDIQSFFTQEVDKLLSQNQTFTKFIIRSQLDFFPSHLFFHHRTLNHSYSELFLTYLNLDLEISQKYLENYDLLDFLKSFQIILSKNDTTLILDLIFTIKK